jgi:hypothetical protein
MKFVYADPPYKDQAKRHYSDDPKCKEVDMEELIDYLMTFDGWALSMSEPSRYDIEKYCREELKIKPRVGIWMKSFASYKVNVNPAYTFEPVFFYGCRKRTRAQPTIRDHIVCPITTKRGVHGAKPEPVCNWIFDFLNMCPDDEFFDMYPGSGAVTRAWNKRRNQKTLIEMS